MVGWLGWLAGCAPPEVEPLPSPLRDGASAYTATGWTGSAGTGSTSIPDDRPRAAARAAPPGPALVLPGVSETGPAEVILRDGPGDEAPRDRQDRLLARYGRAALARGTFPSRVRIHLAPGDLARLRADRDVARIEPVAAFGPDDNAGAALRHATGVADLLSAGLDGSTGSGRNPRVGSVYVAIVDVGDLDADHPAWRDRRELVSVWDAATGGYVRLPPDAELADDPGNHGSAIATQLFADDTVDRSGLAPGVRWMFVRNERADLGLDEPILERVDVVNLSQSCTSCAPCSQDNWAVEAVDRAMLSGILVVSTPGNVGHDGGCSVRPPGTASGSFTVNATVVSGDLATAPLTRGSARGGDVHGRSLIDLVAPGGREGPNQADWDDTWRDMGVGTSYAAPLVAAAGADLKHWMNATWGATATDHVGLLYAELLHAGGGEGAPDPVWGFGRLAARALIDGSLPDPWEHRWWVALLDDGETRSLPLAIPAGVGRLSIAAWWHEPNLGTGEVPAWIALGACGPDVCTDAWVEPGAARLVLDDPTAGDWSIVLEGLEVPASSDPWFLPGEPRRELHVVATWEP